MPPPSCLKHPINNVEPGTATLSVRAACQRLDSLGCIHLYRAESFSIAPFPRSILPDRTTATHSMTQSHPTEATSLLPSTTTSTGSTGHSSRRNPSFTLRRAHYGDLAGAARTCSLAFWDDVLFGRLIHTRRTQYPLDSDKYWYRRFMVDWWDWSHVYLVTTEPVSHEGEGAGKWGGQRGETVTGFAHWSRIAPGRAENRMAGWELAWWDPSKSFFIPLHRVCVAM